MGNVLVRLGFFGTGFISGFIVGAFLVMLCVAISKADETMENKENNLPDDEYEE